MNVCEIMLVVRRSVGAEVCHCTSVGLPQGDLSQYEVNDSLSLDCHMNAAKVVTLGNTKLD